MASRDQKFWGWAVCWLAVRKSLWEKPQHLSFLLVASPRKKALFILRLSLSTPGSAMLAATIFLHELYRKEERGKKMSLSKRVHIMALYRQECSQHSHCAT